MPTDSPTIWTLGHSTRAIEEFLDLLRENKIETLVDVRHFPGSRRFPHFNKSELAHTLPNAGVRYEHLVELGGRRPVNPDSRLRRLHGNPGLPRRSGPPVGNRKQWPHRDHVLRSRLVALSPLDDRRRAQ